MRRRRVRDYHHVFNEAHAMEVALQRWILFSVQRIVANNLFEPAQNLQGKWRISRSCCLTRPVATLPSLSLLERDGRTDGRIISRWINVSNLSWTLRCSNILVAVVCHLYCMRYVLRASHQTPCSRAVHVVKGLFTATPILLAVGFWS